ncbi:zinc carboxypeptidase A 1-like [Pararge aegeria]|uniref:zinc carboxypeptidase A 1-like n=1 Tax=Pararge aegeria TaxID=116150 RepID=UPI0019CFEAE6|nr:zinc carboxypeptidase A 1-like [Pararge aegeria]
MARRLALLALLACAAVALRPPSRPTDTSDSDSSDPSDPFAFWDEYVESYEKTTPPRLATVKPNTKVLLRSKVPKSNVTKKSTKSDEKVIKTTINISSHTNIYVTKIPPIIESFTSSFTRIPQGMYVNYNEQPPWVNGVSQISRFSTKKPAKSRPSTTRRPPTTPRPRTTTRRQRTTTTRRPTRTVRQKTKTTKVPKQKVSCSQKKPGWISSFFQDNKIKKSSKKQEKSGFLSRIYNWLVGSKSSWFSSEWFEEEREQIRTKTTTPIPPTTSTENWFQSFIESEDIDETNMASETIKKSAKKSLKKNYKGYQLIRAYPDVLWKVHSLLDLQEDAEGSGLMWWTAPSLNSSTDLLVPPDLLVDVKDHLKSYKIDFDVIIWDLQKAIAYENPKLSKKQRLELEQLHGHPLTWRRYHRYADILRYLEYLQHSYADIVELVPLGRTSEGLPLVAVKVSIPSNETQSSRSVSKGQKKKWKLRSNLKPAVWLDGGAHAQEWIAPAVTTWILHNLVEGDKGLGADREVLNEADFYIMPVLNPDGYEHSHTHDRLWRKTRSRSPDHSDDYYVGWFPWNWGRTECVGVDTDRNWDYHWSEKGSSSDPCADNYAGPHPFSEPETRAVSEFLSEHRGLIKVYISMHAYSQAWLLPSTHSHASFADDGVLMEMGKLATAALADMYGTKYQVGTAAEIRQPASGMSHDWAKARAGIKFSYHVDLRDSFGPYGYLLPGSQIVSTARETWQAVRAIVDNLSPGFK